MTKTLGIIGVGAFGEFMLKHISPYFDISVFDARRDLTDVGTLYNVKIKNLEDVARCDVVILSVPVQEIETVTRQIVSFLRPGQLVMDVASVKCMPTDILKREIPEGIDIVSLHPLFGPQSGRLGINGMNVAVVNVRGIRGPCVIDYLKRLNLTVFETTAEKHDQQMAYVMGLTHMIAKVFKKIDVPEIAMETKTFALLREAISFVIDDSDELFYAIQRDNPYVDGTKEAFFTAVKELEVKLHQAK
jgi:prephenate dehydrogenase